MIPTSKTSAFAFSLALGGLCALGYLVQTGVQAQTANRGTVMPGSRFVYGPGSSGFGYYNSSSAAPATGSATRTTTAPARGSSNTGARRGRDWSTGRRMTVAKPWLRPMD